MNKHLCMYCGKRKAVDTFGGLCPNCYLKPEALEQLHKLASTRSANAQMPPTQAPPGSEEKIEVLEERARLKQSLWHPKDSNGDTN